MTPEPGPHDHARLPDLLATLGQAPLTVLGQLRTASNATLLCEAGQPGEAPVRCVYKPVAGERPLWDFPEGTLGRREVLAFGTSQALGWDLVPATAWREDGPYGEGMCQAWVESGPRTPVDVVPPADARGLVVIEGEAPDGSSVVLEHEDAYDVRRLAVFDAVINNADRKGGHLLADPGGRLWAIDHGVAFAADPKLRTVLWGWAGEPIPEPVLADLVAFAPRLEALLAAEAHWLSGEEAAAALDRLEGLLESGTHPEPTDEWPFLPWPVM